MSNSSNTNDSASLQDKRHIPLALKGSTDTVFVSTPHKASMKEIWAFFKRLGSIKDIILPKNGDRYGRRFGFMKARTREDAEKLKKVIMASNLLELILKADMATKKSNSNNHKGGFSKNSKNHGSKVHQNVEIVGASFIS